jgi:hypothetical protein
MRLACDRPAAAEPVDVWACLVEIEALVRATWRNIGFCNRVKLQNALMNLSVNARDANSRLVRGLTQ